MRFIFLFIQHYANSAKCRDKITGNWFKSTSHVDYININIIDLCNLAAYWLSCSSVCNTIVVYPRLAFVVRKWSENDIRA